MLIRRLETLDAAALSRKLEQGGICQSRLEELAQAPATSSSLKQALLSYLECLQAWSQGAGLEDFTHPLLENPGRPQQALDLAWVLQHDNVGCQTGIYRQHDGGVLLWHSEEDVDSAQGSRFDRLRIGTFRLREAGRDIQLSAFIYPDLMPGPAFGWRSDGYIQAVDTLIMRNPPNIARGILVNVAAWIAWYLGPALDPEMYLNALGPFFDGYALNSILWKGHRAEGRRCEFAGDRMICEPLADQAGSYLFQVNFFCNRRDAQLRTWEGLSPESRVFLQKRQARTRRVVRRREIRLEEKGETGNESADLDFFYKLLGWSAAGEDGYVNSDVKAHFLAQIKTAGSTLIAGAGPGKPYVDAPGNLRFRLIV